MSFTEKKRYWLGRISAFYALNGIKLKDQLTTPINQRRCNKIFTTEPNRVGKITCFFFKYDYNCNLKFSITIIQVQVIVIK